MPRDGSGNYTLPTGNPVVTNTLIEASWANPTMSDIAAQLNNVLTRDGVLGPTLPIKGVDGTVALPSYSFTGSTSSGMYRGATGQLNFSVTGTEILRLSTTQTLTSLGSAPAPVWSFIGDTNTGVYSPGADQIGFSTGGVARATLSNTAFTLAGGTVFTGSGAGLTAVPASNLTGALPAISGANLTGLNASNLGSGTVPDAQLPAVLPALSGLNLTSLNASNLGSGTVPDARFPATLPAVSAANLTSIPAGNLTGNVAAARMSSAFATTLGSNGTVTLPGGWIIKTGVIAHGSANPASAVETFAVQFPTAVVSVIACCSNGVNMVGVNTPSATAVTFTIYNRDSGSNAIAGNIHWIALGN